MTSTIPTKLYHQLLQAVADADCAWDDEENLMDSKDWREVNAQAIAEAHHVLEWIEMQDLQREVDRAT